MITTRTKATALAVAALTAVSLSAAAPTASAAPFKVTAAHPTLDDWTAQMKYLLSSNATDEGIALNLEAGKSGVAAAKFFRSTGQRNPNWWWKFVGPTSTKGNVSTAYFYQGAPGYPTVKKPSKWKKINGNWRISNETLCHYIGIYKLGKTTFCK